MEQRKAEESRLLKLIEITNPLPAHRGRLEDLGNQVATNGVAPNSRDIGEIQSTLIDISKRWEPIGHAWTLSADRWHAPKSNPGTASDTTQQQFWQVNEWMEQSSYLTTNTKRVEAWMELIEAYKTDMALPQTLEQFAEQSKSGTAAGGADAGTMAVANRAPARNELTEVTRLEIGRFQARWQNSSTNTAANSETL